MTKRTASAVASPNIALIKYWGNRDHELRLPSNGSISLTLGGLETRTTVTFDETLPFDRLTVDGSQPNNSALVRVSEHLDRIRHLAGIHTPARVESRNNFPTGVGIASSASAFAALTLAGTAAADLSLNPKELSRLARLGSGSACRSIFGGYVEWYAGETHADSHAEPLAPPEHWDLIDLIAVISREHKGIGSTQGHTLADTSPLQSARVTDALRRLNICRDALLHRDFPTLASVVEQDSNLMHAVMFTSIPALIYWSPTTIEVMQAVTTWRAEGLEVCYTIDAGPNVHCLCTKQYADQVEERLGHLPGVIDLLRAHPGGPASVI
ncbi:MAG: diphosphomevalonate decarboxylase [Anaerolineales bacterium]|nr:diphosphomevalonate decarboxylase [Anaerolineales bacterium]